MMLFRKITSPFVIYILFSKGEIFMKIMKKEMLEVVGTLNKNINNKENVVFFSVLSHEKAEVTETNANRIGKASLHIKDVEGNKGFALNAKILEEILRKITVEEITVTNKESVVVIEGGASKFNLLKINNCAPMDFQVAEEEQMICFTPEQFKSLANKVKSFVAKDDSRPVFTGVVVKKTAGGVGFFATDAHVMYKGVRTMEWGNEEYILPIEIFNLNPTTDISIKINKKFSRVQYGNFEFTFANIIGNSLNFDGFIPKEENGLEFKIKKENFLDTISRVAICAETVGATPVKMVFGNNEVLLSAEAQGIGTVKEVLPLMEANHGLNGKKIAFSARYLKLISQMETSVINGFYFDELKPFLFTEEGKNDEKFILSPVRTNW